MAQLQANGLQIEYDTFGDAESDPLLLIMGLGTQMTAWTPDFCNRLADHGHFVVRFDNRDVGLSTKFDRAVSPTLMGYAMNHFLGTGIKAPYTLTDMASDAIGVLDALEIKAAHVVGASMGGMIAQLVAAGHPKRVRSLTSLMSSSGDPKLPQARPEIFRHLFTGRPRTSNPKRMMEYSIRTMKLISSPDYPRSDEEWREIITTSTARSYYPQGFARHVAAIVADGSRVQRLKKITVPTLVVHGKSDQLVPVECGVDTARHITGARLELIDGMGHDLPPQLVETLATLIASHTCDSARTQTASVSRGP